MTVHLGCTLSGAEYPSNDDEVAGYVPHIHNSRNIKLKIRNSSIPSEGTTSFFDGFLLFGGRVDCLFPCIGIFWALWPPG
jgi:hypothetical protein